MDSKKGVSIKHTARIMRHSDVYFTIRLNKDVSSI